MLISSVARNSKTPMPPPAMGISSKGMAGSEAISFWKLWNNGTSGISMMMVVPDIVTLPPKKPMTSLANASAAFPAAVSIQSTASEAASVTVFTASAPAS